MLAVLAALGVAASAAPKPAVPASPPAALLQGANAGDAQAQDRLGAWYDDHGDGATAVAWYKKSADAGWINGAHHMGVMLEGGAEGKGVPQDCAKSRAYLLKASTAGSAASTFRIGYQYYRGVCADKDYALARDWFDRSRTAAGTFYLGLMAEYGQGRGVDLTEAASLYEKAYVGGHMGKSANQRAHLAYDGSPQDLETAYLWYLRGVADADEEDRARLQALRRRLSEKTRRRVESEARQR